MGSEGVGPGEGILIGRSGGATVSVEGEGMDKRKAPSGGGH